MASTKQLYWVGQLVNDPRLTPAVKAQARHILSNPEENPGDLLTIMFKLCPKESKTTKGTKGSWDGSVKPSKPVTPESEKVFGAEYPLVQPGYYACPGADGVLKFFRVSFGAQFSKAPSMADRVFVKTVVGGHPDQKCSAVQARSLLALVKDAKADRERYGIEIGSCGKCNTHLTDDLSRARGFGPDCWDTL